MRSIAAWSFALVALLLHPTVTKAVAPKPAAGRPMVILDADLGDDIDDAFAVAWALKTPRLDVRAILTASGDTNLRDRMTRRFTAILRRPEIAIGHGVPTRPGTVFTQSAWAQSTPARPAAPDGIALALDLIRRNPGKVTLIALAPLSNIGAMIARDAATFAKLRAVYAMSGSIRRGYDVNGRPNLRPEPEYNAAQAPAALRALLASGVPLTLLPLDSTQIRLNDVQARRFASSRTPVTATLTTLTAQWRARNAWKQSVPTLFDAVPVAAVIDPALCPSTPMRIAVDYTGFTKQVTGPSNARICLKARDEALLDRLLTDLIR